MEIMDTALKLLKKIQEDKEFLIKKGELRQEKSLAKVSKTDIPYELPDGWIWVRLGDYCMKVTDYVASGSFASLKENVLITNEPNFAIMVKTADFSNGFTKNLTYTDERGYNFLKNSNLFGGELILSNIGSIGKVFIVPKLNTPMTLASNSVMVKLTDNKLTKYLYYFFLSPLGQRTLKKISSGTSMLKFNKTELKNIIVPIAPLHIQIKIVKCLDLINGIIDSKVKQITCLEQLVKSRFIEMFGDSDFPTTELINLIQKGKGLSYGIVVPGDDVDTGIPMIRPSDFRNGIIDLSNLYKVSPDIEVKYKKTRLIGNELLVQVIGQPGQVMLATPECFNMNVTRNLAVICPDEKAINRIYLKEFIEQEDCQRTLMKSTKQSTLKQLPLNILKKLQIKVPPIDLQNRFADFVAQVDQSKLAVQQSLNELETLKKSLMQQYFG